MHIVHTTLTTPVANPIQAQPMADWNLVTANWWYQRLGDFEVHLSSDGYDGWEIEVSRDGEIQDGVTYKAEFADALRCAERKVAQIMAIPVLH